MVHLNCDSTEEEDQKEIYDDANTQREIDTEKGVLAPHQPVPDEGFR